MIKYRTYEYAKDTQNPLGNRLLPIEVSEVFSKIKTVKGGRQTGVTTKLLLEAMGGNGRFIYLTHPAMLENVSQRLHDFVSDFSTIADEYLINKFSEEYLDDYLSCLPIMDFEIYLDNPTPEFLKYVVSRQYHFQKIIVGLNNDRDEGSVLHSWMRGGLPVEFETSIFPHIYA